MERTEAFSGRPLGDALRGLRLARRLSLADLAARSGVARAAIGAWESGLSGPSGAALDAVLSALGTEPGLRSRMLATAAPRYAQDALRAAPLGPPAHAGQILRAVRLRGGVRQGQLARALGVTQGHVSRWEAGDLLLSDEQWERCSLILKATELEAKAFRAVAAKFGSMGDDHGEFELGILYELPSKVQTTVLLAIESRLWRRATESVGWSESLCKVISLRANASIHNGDLSETDEIARRALGLAKSFGCWRAATHAFYAQHWRQRRLRPDWESEARRIEEWIALLPPSGERAWMLNCLGLAHAHMGDEDDALTLTERALEMAEAHGVSHPDSRATDLGEVWLALGRPDTALEAVGSLQTSAAIYLRAMSLAKLGKPVPDALVESAHAALADRSWLDGQKLAAIVAARGRLERPNPC